MTCTPALSTEASHPDGLETTLKHRTAEWFDMADVLSDWVSIIDVDFRIMRSNRAVENFLGLPREAALGQTCYELMHGKHLPSANCPISLMLKTLRRAEAEIELPDGRWVSVTIDPLVSPSGRLDGVVHVVRDITDIKVVEAERETLIRELETLLEKVRTFEGLIPICATCRRVRDENGSWCSLETFVRTKAGANFSHGICPDCLQKECRKFDL